MKVPFLDIKAQNDKVENEILSVIQKVIGSCAFAGGPYVKAFEDDFANYCGSLFAVGVGNGTDALWLALNALGIKAGDEVITVPSTFMATAEAISCCGAKPVFVDIDEQTYTLDPDLLESAITSKTKAIIPVHLFGQMADMDPIIEIAKKHGLAVVEDACQAHGAEYKGKKAGTMGIAGAFSFYPGKNLGAFGEAGAVITSDPEIQQRMRTFRDHGQACKYYHSMIGWNARMDGIQGAVLQVKLRLLEQGNAARSSHAAFYRQQLNNLDQVILPQEAHYAKHVYHIFAVRVKNRDAILRRLDQKGISCGIHYPIPVHLQEAYRFLGYREGTFPVAEQCAREFLSLPMYPELTVEQLDYVTQELRSCVGTMKKDYAFAL